MKNFRLQRSDGKKVEVTEVVTVGSAKDRSKVFVEVRGILSESIRVEGPCTLDKKIDL